MCVSDSRYILDFARGSWRGRVDFDFVRGACLSCTDRVYRRSALGRGGPKYEGKRYPVLIFLFEIILSPFVSRGVVELGRF